MSESKMVTEREAVIRERRAFVAGSQFEDEAWRQTLSVNHTSGADSISASRRLYPLPKVERFRSVRDPERPDVEYTVIQGALHFRWTAKGFGAWDADVIPRFTAAGNLAARFRLWADLLTNPTELVEDGAP